jgi:hypothetical protein
VRLRWAKLLKRVFKIDMKHCPNCGGLLKLIAAAAGSAGVRENPQPPAIAGACTALGAGPRPGLASGLMRTDSPQTVPEKDDSRLVRHAQQIAAASEDRFKRTRCRAPSCPGCHAGGKNGA